MRVCIVVLGDLERSPRMVNHARSLAAEGADVDLIGYGASVSHGESASGSDDPRIRRHLLAEPRDLPGAAESGLHSTRSARWLAAGVLRMIVQTVTLLKMLLTTAQRPDVLLVQTPPALPTLAVALAAARIRSTRLVLDWHNLTCSVLALRTGATHPLVRVMALYERLLGRHAGAHLCVSRAMADHLERWGMTGVHVVRDRPTEIFQPAPADVRSALVQQIFAGSALERASAGAIRLVVVPTSWSLDDDFDLLLMAIDRCEALIEAHEARHPHAPFPTIAMVLTGRGPMRSRYQPLFEGRRGRRVHARAVWLSGGEYPLLMGAADLGICVHRSASGLDLPMKICDMFGAGVAVCALDYGPCLSELVRDGENGLLFRTGEELAGQLFDLMLELPHEKGRLDHLRRGAVASAAMRWHPGWTAEAWPVLRAGREAS